MDFMQPQVEKCYRNIRTFDLNKNELLSDFSGYINFKHPWNWSKTALITIWKVLLSIIGCLFSYPHICSFKFDFQNWGGVCSLSFSIVSVVLVAELTFLYISPLGAMNVAYCGLKREFFNTFGKMKIRRRN